MSSTYKYIVDILAKNGQFVSAMNQNVQKVTELDKKVNSVNSASKKAMDGMVKFAAAAGIAFSVDRVVDFVSELAKMGGQAEGVRTAFSKIAKASDLESLRKSVHGTVADLELMKRAVSANNFGIPVKELGNLFAFATKRAQDTGQSVDYLVDSIVMGIGRKSPLILDNLGISAAQLKEKLNGVAMESASVGDITKAVGEIAADSFKKTGEIIDTNAIKLQSLTAQWENAKLSLAENPGFQTRVSGEINELSDNLEVFFSKNLTGWEKFKAAVDVFGWAGQVEYLAMKSRNMTAEQMLNSKATEVVNNTVTKTKETAKIYADTLEGLAEKLKDYNDAIKKTSPSDEKSLMVRFAQINAIEKQIESIDKLKSSMKIMAEDNSNGFRIGELGLPEAYLQIKSKTKGNVSNTPEKTKEIAEMSKHLENMNGMLDRNQEKVDKWKKALIEKQQAVTDAFAQGFGQIGESIVSGLGLASDGFEGFVKSLADTAIQLISMMLAQSLANSIFGATSSGAATGPAAVFTTPAFIATAIGGVLGAFAAIPKFADGGIAYGPTMGLMGEYPGASSNPEVIAPLSKLQGMLNSGGSQTVILQPSIEMGYEGLRVHLKRMDKNVNNRT